MCATMQKPLCRLCATRHYAHEPHNFPGSDEASDDDVAVVEKRLKSRPPAAVVIDVRTSDPEATRRGADIRQALLTGKVLTVAERSRKYRLEKGDEYRKRNRERMARIRGSPSSEE